MALPRHSLALWIGAALLGLCLPACASLESPSPSVAVEEGPPGALEKLSWPGELGQAGERGPDWKERCCCDIDLACEDYGHFYSCKSLAALAAGLGGAAALANTSADQSVRDWYQGRPTTATVDGFSRGVSYAGQLWVLVPIGLECAALAGKAGEGYATDGGWYEWGNRSLRATAVGFPPVLALYGLLGSARPDRHDSRWRPFNDFHGVSGHTFVGAVPFLTAAAMTDRYWLKVPLFAGSFLSGWSRLHDDRHYLSQIALGWWIAYLAVASVDETQAARQAIRLVPTTTADGPGVGLQIDY